MVDIYPASFGAIIPGESKELARYFLRVISCSDDFVQMLFAPA
jgi:hypothetical protein